MLLNDKPKEALKNFLELYSTIYSIDTIKANIIINDLINNYSNKMLQLENKWYEQLKTGYIDYSIYNDEFYFCDLWYCWIIYSRKYLKSIIEPKNLVFDFIKNSESVLDLGCGIGYTTASLKQLFPTAHVYGTNIKDTKQYSFCKYMSEKYSFTLIDNILELPKSIDLIFASEYFEHIEKPLNHL